MELDGSGHGGEKPEEPQFDRRRGPRRGSAEGDVPVERRQNDRRKRKPGIAGLFGAIFGSEKESKAPEGEEA